ncbi:MAG: anti-sigma factor domain-containing protein [Streptosporangiaceae bacterium]
MRGRGAGLHTLVGAYVMDAVHDHDRAEFARHLQTCEPCREEVRSLREATARLGEAAAIRPRPELREQTLQAAARIRQLPPLVTEPPARLGRRPARPSAGTGWLARVRASGATSWPMRIAVTTAAVLAVAAVVLGINARTMRHTLTVSQERDAAIASVLDARDRVSLTAHLSSGGTATVMMSHRARTLVFIATGLTKLPATKAYELWLMGPAGDRPAGMLPPPRHGMSGPMVVGHLARGERLGLTVEPSAGSRRPTSAPIVLVRLGD